MSTLAEIEAAVDQLPPTQQEALYEFLANRLDRNAGAPPAVREVRMAGDDLAARDLPAVSSMSTELGSDLSFHPLPPRSPEQIAAWLATARGAGRSGMTTDEIMALTRGEE